jgi:tyrosine-protein kinase Etk/Wzc
MTALTPPRYLEAAAPPPLVPEEPFDARRAFGFLLRQWHVIAAVTLLVLMLGMVYVLCAPPSYTASILVQVDADQAARVLMAEPPGVDQKGSANDEMEVLRSRLVLGSAVDETGANIEARALRTPLIGAALERAQTRLAGFGIGSAPPPARIELAAFELPSAHEEERFVLTVVAGGRFTLAGPALAQPLAGEVGVPLRAQVSGGTLVLAIRSLDAARGERFALVRHDRLETIETLQRNIEIELRGKLSNVISAALEGSDPARVAATVAAMGRAYLGHNGASRAGDAAQRAAVIEGELPRLQRELEAAESRYNAARHSHATINTEEETRALLQRSGLAQERIESLRQRRDALAARFTPEHPEMLAVADQLRGAEAQLADITAAQGRIPRVEQDVLGLARDLKVRTDAFAAMLAAGQKLRLESASRLGSARLIDGAEVPARPTRPRAAVALPIAGLAGLLLGVLAAWLRQALSNRIADPFALAQQLGLPFSALVPHASSAGRRLRNPRLAPFDEVAESMRRFVAVLGPAMRTARNNIVLVAGPMPRTGASFVAGHLAATLAASGSRVLLIDGDLRGDQRSGQLSTHFELAPGPGLADLVRGEATTADAVRPRVRENLDVLPAGRPVATWAASVGLPGEPALGALLDAFSRSYDYVLVDAAPVLAVSDALALGRHAGTVFTVVRAGVSTFDEVGEMLRQFGQAGLAPVGFVFNDANLRWVKHRYWPRRRPVAALERAP